MKLFTKEKDTLLKVVNAVLLVIAIFAVIITIGTGINIINKPNIMTYKEYAKDVCTIDKLEYECLDDSCTKELDAERKKTCQSFFLEYKKTTKRDIRTNTNNFIISLIASIVLISAIHLINKKI